MWVGQHQLSSVWRRFASIISSWFMSSPTFFFSKECDDLLLQNDYKEKTLWQRCWNKTAGLCEFDSNNLLSFEKVCLNHIELIHVNNQIQALSREEKNTYGTWLWSLWALPWEMQMHCRIWLQTTGFHLEHLWQVKLVLQKTFKGFNRTGN